jgi:DNA-binding IclR family transcriptional regulator
MTETEILSFVLEKQEVSSSEVVEKFNVTPSHACVVLRTLEDKGLLEKNKIYGAKYRLTQRAREISHQIKEKDENIGFIFLFGLAAAILLRVSKESNDSAGEEPKQINSFS